MFQKFKKLKWRSTYCHLSEIAELKYTSLIKKISFYIKKISNVTKRLLHEIASELFIMNIISLYYECDTLHY